MKLWFHISSSAFSFPQATVDSTESIVLFSCSKPPSRARPPFCSLTGTGKNSKQIKLLLWFWTSKMTQWAKGLTRGEKQLQASCLLNTTWPQTNWRYKESQENEIKPCSREDSEKTIEQESLVYRDVSTHAGNKRSLKLIHGEKAQLGTLAKCLNVASPSTSPGCDKTWFDVYLLLHIYPLTFVNYVLHKVNQSWKHSYHRSFSVPCRTTPLSPQVLFGFQYWRWVAPKCGVLRQLGWLTSWAHTKKDVKKHNIVSCGHKA